MAGADLCSLTDYSQPPRVVHGTPGPHLAAAPWHLQCRLWLAAELAAPRVFASKPASSQGEQRVATTEVVRLCEGQYTARLLSRTQRCRGYAPVRYATYDMLWAC